MGKLNALQVKALSTPGKYGDGGGLRLNVTASGSKNWTVSYRTRGKLREKGLGAYPAVTLSEARVAAGEVKLRARQGGDPLQEMQRESVTFRQLAYDLIEARAPGWKNGGKSAAQWRSALDTYAMPLIGDMHPADIAVNDALRVLTPIWATKSETAAKLRNRCEMVWATAVIRGLAKGQNPFMWRNNLALILPAQSKVRAVRHHKALPYSEIPAFMTALAERRGVAAGALTFTVLTASRSGETRHATWSEVDTDAATWRVPAVRMKSGREHVVPLSKQALQILSAMPRMAGCDLLFPGAGNRVMSDMTMAAVLRRLDVDATVHGMRSSFRDWCGDATDFPREVAEACLAHQIGSATERAYRRSDALQKRRELLDAWSQYCIGEEL